MGIAVEVVVAVTVAVVAIVAVAAAREVGRDGEEGAGLTHHVQTVWVVVENDDLSCRVPHLRKRLHG
jgi:hypothetical protein